MNRTDAKTLVDEGCLYKLLNNRTYIGKAVHKGTVYPGEHEAIISQALWDKVHSILADSPRLRAARTGAQTPALLKGLIFGPTGRATADAYSEKWQALPLLRLHRCAQARCGDLHCAARARRRD